LISNQKAPEMPAPSEGWSNNGGLAAKKIFFGGSSNARNSTASKVERIFKTISAAKSAPRQKPPSK
jgi:hypothetical protein